MVKLVIFDLDGVLIDSKEHHFEAFNRALGEEYKLSREEHINDYDELSDGLNDFLNKVFPIPKVKEYILRFLSSCLSGEIREEKFRFWTGKGGNGKSKLVELIDFAFGDYSRSMDVAYLTTKRGSSSAASPELESVKHARFVSMSEPEKTDEITLHSGDQIPVE